MQYCWTTFSDGFFPKPIHLFQGFSSKIEKLRKFYDRFLYDHNSLHTVDYFNEDS